MFETTSRYYAQYVADPATLATAEGRRVAYVRRRFLPQGASLPLLVEVTVNEGDRLDLIAARTLGDPEQFWRVCDANNAMNPAELTAVVGQVLRVPVPQVEGYGGRPLPAFPIPAGGGPEGAGLLAPPSGIRSNG